MKESSRVIGVCYCESGCFLKNVLDKFFKFFLIDIGRSWREKNE